MRIGFDAKRLFLNNRGLGNYARNLLYGLVKYHVDNEFYLYTPRVSNEYVSPGLLNSNNVHTRTPSGVGNFFRNYWRSVNLGSNSKNDNLDIFHGLSQELPLDINRTSSKSIVTIHDMIFLKYPEFYKPIDRWIYFNKVKFAVKNTDLILAISNQTKDDLVNTFKLDETKIRVIYQSCNEIFYSKRSDKELEEVRAKWGLPEQYIFFVGALNENKNPLIILKALNQLKNRLDIPLVIVGSGDDYREKLEVFAAENNLTHRLIFAHDIASPSPIELSAFYQMASVFVFPSFYEGFGIPVLESRFSGTPVIASNSTCLEEVGENDTHYFDPKNSEELAELIIKVYENGKPTINVDNQFNLKGSTELIYQMYKE